MQCLRIFLLLGMLSVWPHLSLAQKTMRIVEWNVENAFDTQHDEGHNDREFLPNGSHHWTNSRYRKKIDEVGRTIISLASQQTDIPAIIGLCEVENDSVLVQLTERSALRSAGYRYIMTDSPDRRGINVAMLYHPTFFRPIRHHSIRVPSAQHGLSPTRDILYVEGRTTTGDTLHVFVCHLPSKTGGMKNTGKLRNLAAQTLRGGVDSLLAINSQARIIVMGDFNATPREPVFKKLIPPLRETLPTSRRELNRPIGTYKFQGLWSYLDHILVSPNILTLGQAHEARLPHLLNEEGAPFRAFRGPSYIGGISDHLPLVLDIVLGE